MACNYTSLDGLCQHEPAPAKLADNRDPWQAATFSGRNLVFLPLSWYAPCLLHPLGLLMANSPSSPAVSLDDLIALSDEIAALVRSGVPLDRGLLELGRDMPGRLGRLAAAVADRTAQGEPLDEALDQSAGGLPEICRAVVTAGLRAGRLPAALESLAASLRRLHQTQRAVAAGMLYPLLVLAVAWAFFAFFTAWVAPVLAESFHGLRVRGAGVMAPLLWCGRGAWLWGPAGEVVLLALAFLGCGSTRAALAGSGGTARLWARLPWMKGMIRASRAATLADLLALLLENRVPLGEALRLAGAASGDSQLAAAALDSAAAVERGGETSRSAAAPPDGVPPVLPPLLNWLIAGSRQDPTLLPALRHAAEGYHLRASVRPSWPASSCRSSLRFASAGSPPWPMA